MMYKFLSFVFFISLMSCNDSKTEEKIDEKKSSNTAFILSNTIENSNGMTGEINIMGYFVTPIFQGELQEDGSFSIELPQDFDQITTKAFHDYNTSDIAEYELNYSTALESFPNAADLTFTGKESQLAFAGKYYRFEVTNGDQSAYIYPASSENFVKYVVGTKDAVPETGDHYYYIYAKEAFTIKGELATENLFEDGSEEVYTRTDYYDLDIKKGWNLIYYEINELTKSSLSTEKIAVSHVSNKAIDTAIDSWFMSNK